MGVYIKKVQASKVEAIFKMLGLSIKDGDIIEVSEPHGRLIDADALKVAIHEADFYYDSTEEKCKRHDIGRLVHVLIDGIIDKSPIVIEAEEG